MSLRLLGEMERVAWPLSYMELAPFYDKVESFLGVQGSRDGLAQLPDGAFESPPNFTETELLFKKKVEGVWRDRKVIISRGIASHVQSSGSSSQEWPHQSNVNCTLAAALRTGRTSIRTDAVVSHLTVEPNTTLIKGVACIDRSVYSLRGGRPNCCVVCFNSRVGKNTA
jgi:choline dehydrogenase-like flavoprotein